MFPSTFRSSESDFAADGVPLREDFDPSRNVTAVRFAVDRFLNPFADREARGEHERTEDHPQGGEQAFEPSAATGRRRAGSASRSVARSRLPRRRRFSGKQPSILEPEHAIGARAGKFFVVRDQDERRAVALDVIEDQAHHLLRRGAVEVAGRLVREHDLRAG